MLSTRLGLFFAMSAVIVNAPRLVLAFLSSDGIEVPAHLRAVLLTSSAVATALLASGGGAYLAHAAVTAARHRRTLSVLWVLVLFGTAAIVTPLVVASLHRYLDEVIPSPLGRWAWALAAVLLVELVAAGALVSVAAARQPAEQLADQLAPPRSYLDQLTPTSHDLLTSRLSTSPSTSPSNSEVLARSLPIHCRYACGRSFARVEEERGHLAWCSNKPRPSRSHVQEPDR